jgi:hypothetical protein
MALPMPEIENLTTLPIFHSTGFCVHIFYHLHVDGM